MITLHFITETVFSLSLCLLTVLYFKRFFIKLFYCFGNLSIALLGIFPSKQFCPRFIGIKSERNL